MEKRSIVGIIGSKGEFVGCGFLVTPRHVLTCAHVINAAFNLSDPPISSSLGKVIELSFPYLDNKKIRAKVVYWKPDFHNILQLPSVNQGIEEDIAGLELLEEIQEVKPIKVETYIENMEFKALGYPKKTTQGAVAKGTVQAAIPFGWVQIDGSNNSDGFWVAPGYSGTPIWDLQDNEDVYGMMVAVRKEDDMASKIAYMIPFDGLKKAIAFLKLLDILPKPKVLEAQNELWQAYQTIYEQCKPSDWNHAMPIPETPSEILAYVNDMSPSDLMLTGKKVEQIWKFVACLVTHQSSILTESEKQPLRNWGNQQFSEFPTLIDFVEKEQKQKQPKPRQSATTDPCLMIEVSPNRPPYNTRAFFIKDSQIYDPNNHETWKEIFCWDFQRKREDINDLQAFEDDLENELKVRLSGYIKTCEKKYQCDSKFRLELILPLSLMNQPIERMELEYGSFETLIPGSTFHVVVRSYERTTEEYQHDLGIQWEEKWRRLENNTSTYAHNCLADVSAKFKVPQMRAAYQLNSQTVGFKLLEFLQIHLQEKFLSALLGSAAPVAVWLRHSSANSLTTEENLAQKYLDDFLQCNTPFPCSIGRLLDRALELRAEAIFTSIEPDEQNFMVGHHLSLLWENPKLLPPRATKYISE